MQPKIIEIPARKLVGKRITTSLSENKTFELWSNFKPRAREIRHRKNNDFYSVQIFKSDLKLADFTPRTMFEKWAAVEVSEFAEIPQGFECHTLSGGKYAVFILRGIYSEALKTRQSIFAEWLPNSGFEFDYREQFEIMGDKYISPSDPDSEEELWIPIK